MRRFELLHRAALLLGALLALACRERSSPDGDFPFNVHADSARPSGTTFDAIPGESRADRRARCGFAPGALPAETLDASMPQGSRIPIDHFVIVMQENRSFDHYFQQLPAFGQPNVDVAPAGYKNLDPSGEGAMVRPFPLRNVCLDDVPHNWIAVHHQLGGGAMNGFVAAANPRGARALGYYGPEILNYYYALATTFALSDRYFSAVPGPTYPNRMFFLSASSFGHTANTPPPPRDEERSLFHQLERHQVSWVVYADQKTFEQKIYRRLHAEKGEHFRRVSDFEADATAGRLPSVAWVESSYGGADATDEHAPGNVQLGQAFVARIVKAVTKTRVWPRLALILTYDEHGGFFDHVPPPAACPPSDAPRATSQAKRFDQLGVRVPFIVVSPFAKKHYVSHHTYSHTSVLRLVQARFNLPALSGRDANDVPPFDLFDFSEPTFLTPPVLPDAVIDPSERARCRAAAPTGLRAR